MKHTLKITILLLFMFLMTQFIGLYVTNHYLGEDKELPYGLEFPEAEKQSDYYGFLTAIIIAFVIAIVLFLFLSKIKIEFVLKLWFFIVVLVALSISIFSLTSNFDKIVLFGAPLIAFLIALPLAIIKIYKRNFLLHNITEFLIYPGIAVIFIPILNIYTIAALLIVISVYDMWAVWHSGIMQKMAKYQIDKLKIFSGFFVPYYSQSVKNRISKWKKTLKKSELEKKKIKISVAILGGGDIVFPIITAGVMLRTFGIYSSLLVILGATLGLAYLFFFAKKKKFYPAMPFITAGIFLAMLISYLIF